MNCHWCGRNGHLAKRLRDKCYTCGEEGHFFQELPDQTYSKKLLSSSCRGVKEQGSEPLLFKIQGRNAMRNGLLELMVGGRRYSKECGH